MKEKIKTVLTTHKIICMEKNKILAQKFKEQRDEGLHQASLQKQSMNERNKAICQAVKSDEKYLLEKKKRDEV